MNRKILYKVLFEHLILFFHLVDPFVFLPLHMVEQTHTKKQVHLHMVEHTNKKKKNIPYTWLKTQPKKNTYTNIQTIIILKTC